jgi:hypothetical protein
MNRLLKIFSGALVANFLIVFSASAFCPVCTVAVGAGLGLSRWLGIDDTISGLWVGAVILSSAFWLINWLRAKKISFWAMNPIVIIASYLLVIIPLYYAGIMGHPYNRLWNMDKILLGTIIGSLVFYGVSRLYNYMKKKNNGHAHFPMEKVALPVGALIIFSFIFFYITK